MPHDPNHLYGTTWLNADGSTYEGDAVTGAPLGGKAPSTATHNVYLPDGPQGPGMYVVRTADDKILGLASAPTVGKGLPQDYVDMGGVRYFYKTDAEGNRILVDQRDLPTGGGGAAGPVERWPGEIDLERRTGEARLTQIDASIASTAAEIEISKGSLAEAIRNNDRVEARYWQDRLDRLQERKEDLEYRREEIAGGRAFTRGEREATQAFQAGEAEKQRQLEEKATQANLVAQALQEPGLRASLAPLLATASMTRTPLNEAIGANEWLTQPRTLELRQQEMMRQNAAMLDPAMYGAGGYATRALEGEQAAPQPTNLITPQPSAAPQAGASQIASLPWDPQIIQTPEEQLPVIPAQRGFNGVVNEPTAFLAGEEGPERVAVQPARPGWFNPVGAQRGVGTAPYPTNLVRGMGAERTRELGMGQPEPRLQPMGAQRTRELGLGQYGQLPQAQRDLYGGSRAYQPRTASEFLARRAGMSNLVRRPLTPEQQATYGGSQQYGGPKFVINVA